MEEFDWVTALSLCTPKAVFENLKKQIEKDVQIRNAQRSRYAHYAYSTQTNGDNFTVLIDSNNAHRSVTFSITESGFAVVDNHNEKILDAVLILNDEGQCMPEINGQECEFWQLRKMALEQLFVVS